MRDPADHEFDAIVSEVIRSLPESVQEIIRTSVPVIVQDRPSADMLRDLGLGGDQSAADEILGLHTGVMLTEASVDDPAATPTVVHVFRIGHLEHIRDETGVVDAETLREEIRTTILHELGHHFGLDEDDLADLGYA